MPPQFRPEMHASARFLPSLAEKRKEKLEAGGGRRVISQFLSLIRNFVL